MKFSPSVCIALVASLTEEMATQSFAYHAHGTADGDKFCCYPWLVCHDIKSAMHCSLRPHPHDDKSSDWLQYIVHIHLHIT